MKAWIRHFVGTVIFLPLFLASCVSAGGRALLPKETPYEWTSNGDPAYAEAIVLANQLVQSHRRQVNVPSYSAAVAVNGEVVWAGASGWADIGRRVKATPETVYRIGSTSKALTVSATGRLLDQQVVDLDAPISRYVEDLPEKWEALTLRQLHSHTAGLPGYENNQDRLGQIASFTLWKHYDDVADSVTQFDNSPLLFEPGTDFYYSSFDVVLASVVLQAASGTAFDELMRREVFDPVCMASTGADHDAAETGNRAISYGRSGAGFHPWRKVDLSSKLAAGGFVSTPTDLVRLGAAYLQGSFLSEDTVTKLWTPQTLRNGQVNEQSYALGWRSQKVPSDWFGGDLWIVHHGGISKGAMSWLVVYPDLGIVVALTANARVDGFSDFSNPSARLADIFYGAGASRVD